MLFMFGAVAAGVLVEVLVPEKNVPSALKNPTSSRVASTASPVAPSAPVHCILL